MTRLIKVLFLMASFIFCKSNAEEPIRVDYEVYVDKIIKSCSKEIARELDLVCTGSGGRMPYDVEEVRIYFYAYRKATIEQARELEVKATAKLLERINADEQIRPYLREYPFKANRTGISISFRKLDNAHQDNGSVAYMSMIRGKIYYRANDPSTDRFIDLLCEPYEEALKLVQNPLLKKPAT